jgi:hypothetical protein
MQYRSYIKFVFCLLFLPFQLLAQSSEDRDVTGLWKGFIYNDTTQQNYRYEIAISENKGKLYGYSHTYFILDDKQYHGIKKLKVKREGDKIVTEDDELIIHNYPVAPAKGVHQQNKLVLEIKDSVMVLSGLYTTNRTRDYRPLTGYVHVERTNDYRQSALVPHLQELKLAKNLTFLREETSRPEETIAVLKPIKSDEEEKLIVATAKKQEQDMTIKPATKPVIIKTDPVIVKTEIPKPVEPVVVKTAAPVVVKTEPVKVTPPVVVKTEPAKVTPSVVTKPAPVKATEPAVVKATPPVKKTEPVVTKPVPSKPAEPDIAKIEPAKVTPPVIVAPPLVKKVNPVDATAAVDVNKRKVETIQAVYFKSDSLELTLYDNGEVDGDTVSVVMNGEVIMPKVGLSTRAFKKTIDTKAAGDSIQLIMYAESLGSLPPNTGLLIVYDGKDRYEIRFSGDMQKSSAIVFRRRKS